MQKLHVGEEAVGCDEEGNLQEQRHGLLEDIRRPVVVLPVVRLQDHDALVALEGLPYPCYPRGHLKLLLCLLLLELVRAKIQRQQQEVDHEAHRENRQPRVMGKLIGIEEYDFKKKS